MQSKKQINMFELQTHRGELPYKNEGGGGLVGNFEKTP